MKDEIKRRHFNYAASVGLIGLVLIAYAPSFSGGFVWDDFSSIVLNEHVHSFSSAPQLFTEDFHAFGRGQGNFYRPLQALSYLIEYSLSSPMTEAAPGVDQAWVSPFLFRVGNALWHAFATVMLLALLSRLSLPAGFRLAACALYAVHPLHTEAVAYISGRADSMSAAFMFASLFCMLSSKRWVAVGLSGVWFIAGLLSKESTSILPLLAGLLWLTTPGSADRKAARKALLAPVAVSVVIVAVYGILRMTVLRFAEGADGPQVGITTRSIEAMQSLALYFQLFVWPTGLHMERTLNGVPAWLAGVGLLLLLGLIAAAAIAWKRENRLVAFGLLWFLATWFPISGLIPLNAPMAEHWMYVPIAGILMALFAAAQPIMRSAPARSAGAAVVLAVCVTMTFLTVARAQDWTDAEALYRSTLRENPNSTRVQYNLAVTYEDLQRNPSGARRHYNAVLDIYARQRAENGVSEADARYTDEEIESHLSLARIAMERQQFAEAIQHFMPVLRLKPNDATKNMVATAAFGAAQCFMAMGEGEQAQKLFQQAASLNPALQQQINRLLGLNAAPGAA